MYQTSCRAESNAGCDIARSPPPSPPKVPSFGGEMKYATSRGRSGSSMLKTRSPELMKEQATIPGSSSRGTAQ